jgi:tol-pal system protein YbgF
MIMRSLSLCGLLLASAGCWYGKSDGQILREDVSKLDERIARTENTLEQRSKKLDESIDKATKLLARNSADLGTEVAKFADELAKMTGQLAQMRQDLDGLRAQSAQLVGRVDTIEKQLGISRAPDGTVVLDATASFEAAYKKHQAGQYAQARTDFGTFVQKFPQDQRADNALFWVADGWAKEKQTEKAIAAYQKLIDTYPNGDLVDDAFLAAGNAALTMKWCVDAGAYFGELVRRFPTSPLAKDAKERLDYAKKNSRNKKICSS